MARGGVYKSEVEKARNSLLAQQKHPSVDAVRIALGNTGSKTTIHRYLKELEAEDTQGIGGKFPISDALADLVSRLAGQLNGEADQRIADAETRCDEQLRDRTAALEQVRQESAALATQLRRSEEMLQAEKTDRHAVEASLVAATTTILQLEERIAGLNTRLSEHEAHAQALEQKHAHAREALEHYRTSVKEQRDQEQRRHEHQVQQLQVELRESRDALKGKNHELLVLNRDNVRLTEHTGQQDKDLRDLRSSQGRLEGELQALRPIAREHDGLQGRYAQEQLSGEALRADLAAARADALLERELRQAAEKAAALVEVRNQVIEEMLSRLGAVSPREITPLAPKSE